MGCALACKLAWLGCLAWAGVILAGEKNEESIFQGGDDGTGEQKERILHVVLILFSFLFSLFYPSVFIPLFLQFFILWFGSLPCCNAFYSLPPIVGRVSCLRRHPFLRLPLVRSLPLLLAFLLFWYLLLVCFHEVTAQYLPVYCVCVPLRFCLCVCVLSFLPILKVNMTRPCAIVVVPLPSLGLFLSIINPKKTACERSWVCVCECVWVKKRVRWGGGGIRGACPVMGIINNRVNQPGPFSSL